MGIQRDAGPGACNANMCALNRATAGTENNNQTAAKTCISPSRKKKKASDSGDNK